MGSRNTSVEEDKLSNYQGGQDVEDEKSGLEIFLAGFFAFWRAVFRFPWVFWSELRRAIVIPVRCDVCLATKSSSDSDCAVCGRSSSASDDGRREASESKGVDSYLLSAGDQIARIAYVGNLLLLIAWLLVTVAAFFSGLNWASISGGGPSGFFSFLLSLLLSPLTMITAAAPSLYLLYRRSRLEEEPRIFFAWAIVSIIFLLFFPLFSSGITRVLALASIAICFALFASHVTRVLTLRIADSWFDHFTRTFLAEEPFGRPGSHLDTAPFDARATQIGQLGEQTAAVALRNSLRGKAVLFNSLNSPDPNSDGDIDHAVLIGNNCVLLDSKYWKGGEYEVVMGNIFRDGSPFEGGSTNMADRVSEFKQLLPSFVGCIGFVVLANRAALVGGEATLGPGAGLIGIDKLLEDIVIDANSCEDPPDYDALQLLMSLSESESLPRRASAISLEERDWSHLSFAGKIPKLLTGWVTK